MKRDPRTRQGTSRNHPNYNLISNLIEASTREGKKTDAPDPQKSEPQPEIDQSEETVIIKAKAYLKRLTEEGPDRHIELFLACVIAGFAMAQWHTTDKQMELSQRPWVGPSIGQKTPFIVGDGSKPISWLIWFKNSGNSPALHVKWHMTLYKMNMTDKVDHYPGLQHSIDSLSVDQLQEFSILNGVDQPNSMESKPPLYYSGSFKSDIMEGRQQLILGGKVSYKDQIKGDHITTFCVIYVPEDSVFPEGWNICPTQQTAN